ncbi:MAG: sensor histidine kinase [Bdellovibrio sp.]
MRIFTNDTIKDAGLSRKLKYLRFTFFICIFIVSVFSLKFNLEYKIYFLNWVLLPSILTILSSPLVYNYSKNFYLASAITVIPAAVCLLVLVWCSGGLDAPGCIWLTAIPLTMAVLLGIKESIFGFVVVGLFIITSYLSQKTGLQANYIKDFADFEFERMFNLIFFSIYSAITSILYVRTESASQRKLKSQKEEIDGLLKILIHDIGTPLTTIGLSLETVKVEENSSFAKTKNLISNSIENIRILLNQIRTMHSAKDGKAAINLTKINLANIINVTCLDLKLRFEQKNIIVKVNSFKNDLFIFADSSIFQHVILTNLLTNAIKFSPVKSVIEINTMIENDRIGIEIRDYGIGIPEDLKKIISKHNEPTSRKGTLGESGTGYGLPLVFDFVKKLGGQIEVDSSEFDRPSFKKGSAFKLWFKQA